MIDKTNKAANSPFAALFFYVFFNGLFISIVGSMLLNVSLDIV